MKRHNHRSPFSWVDEVFEELNTAFREEWADRARDAKKGWQFGGFGTPRANFYESEEHFRIEVLAPGLDKEDIRIEAEGRTLTVSAQRPAHDTEDQKLLRREFGFGTFERAFRLPKSVDIDQISARYVNGLLILSVPKKKGAKSEGRTINVD